VIIIQQGFSEADSPNIPTYLNQPCAQAFIFFLCLSRALVRRRSCPAFWYCHFLIDGLGHKNKAEGQDYQTRTAVLRVI